MGMVTVLITLLGGSSVIRADAVLGGGHATVAESGKFRRGKNCLWNLRIKEALPGLARAVAHLRLLAGFLKPFLGSVADIVALMDVVHLLSSVLHLEIQFFRVLGGNDGRRWDELLARVHLDAWGFAAPVPQVSSRDGDWAGRRSTANLVQSILPGLSYVFLKHRQLGIINSFGGTYFRWIVF